MSGSSRACIGVVAAALAAWGSGCGGGGAGTPLTAPDVSNIPPGDATGTALSGAYLVTSSTLEGCHCRVGNCALFHGTPGRTLTVTQQGGALAFTSSDSWAAFGGVDADDTFSVGGASPLPSSTGQGQDYYLYTGTFEVSGGLPTGMTLVARDTITATLPGGSYDCDLNASATAQYQGASYNQTVQPLPGAAGIDLPPLGCAIVNSAPQTVPFSTVSITVLDAPDDTVRVSLFPSGYACQGYPGTAFDQSSLVGSATTAGTVPAGTYNLSILCANTANDCHISSVSWYFTSPY